MWPKLTLSKPEVYVNGIYKFSSCLSFTKITRLKFIVRSIKHVIALCGQNAGVLMSEQIVRNNVHECPQLFRGEDTTWRQSVAEVARRWTCQCWPLAPCFLGFLFDLEVWDSMFLRNVRELIPDCMTPHPRRQTRLLKLCSQVTSRDREYPTSCLRHYAVSRNVASSIPDPAALWPRVYSASNRNDYQEFYWGLKAADA
jgi:hypothetical protein